MFLHDINIDEHLIEYIIIDNTIYVYNLVHISSLTLHMKFFIVNLQLCSFEK